MRGMALVQWFPERSRAEEVARSLLEGGIGVDVDEAREPVGPADADPGGPQVAPLAPPPPDQARRSGYAVYVVETDLARARELLGIEPPPGEEAKEADADKKKKTSWKLIILIWVIAMLTIPTAFFFGTYFILSR